MNDQSLNAVQRCAGTDSDGGDKPVMSLHDRLFARVLAPPCAWLALRVGVSADCVTLCSLLTGLAGCASFALGTFYGDVAAVSLLQFSYLLDCIDGDVARARGTASLDGYLRDTFRHQLLGVGIFIGLTLGVSSRHHEWWMLLAGLLGAALATRLVGGLDDQVALEGLIKRLKKSPPATTDAAPAPPDSNVVFDFLRAEFLPDFAQMNWLTLGVIADALWLRATNREWLAVDVLLVGLSAAQFVLKAGGFVLLWRRGVNARVERLATEIEHARRGDDA